MSRRKKQPEHENHERWLVSYADFITLLFAFFVVMFASSQADKNKAKQVSESVRRALEEGQVTAVLAGMMGSDRKKAPPPEKIVSAPLQGGAAKTADLAPSFAELMEKLRAEVAAEKLRVSLEERGLVVSLREAAFFRSGEAEINPQTYPSLQAIAEAINKIPNPVRLEGHTDSVPIHNSRFHSNWELSAARSIAVLELLADRFAVARVRMAIAGYAENAPLDSNLSEEGRARNRRVDIVLLNEAGMRPEPRAAAAVEKK